MIRTTFRIAREVSREHGPFNIKVDQIPCAVKMAFTADRKVAPVGRAIGAGALVEVTHSPGVNRRKPDGSFDDDAIAAEAVEVAVRATNRLVHLIAFVGGGHAPLPALTRFDLEDAKCEDFHDATPREVPLDNLLTQRRILLREPPRVQASAIQKRLDPPSPTFVESESLWHDSVEAFYNGRLRESVVVLRAAIEVAWTASVNRAAEAYRLCGFDPLPGGVLDHFVERAVDWKLGLPYRLDGCAKVLLGFSFKADWESAPTTGRWDRLNAFFQQRHDIAHGTGQPSASQAWDALTLSREVLDKLEAITDGVVRACESKKKLGA